jgi:cell wall-associated NlpC family hydrolase
VICRNSILFSLMILLPFPPRHSLLIVATLFGLCLLEPGLQAQTSRRKKSKPEPVAEEDSGDDRGGFQKSRSQKKRAAPTPTPAATEEKPAARRDASAETPAPHSSPGAAAVSTVSPDEIADFDKQPEAVRRVLLAGLDLTSRNLTYAYGSADPAKGGMDCSGTIYYLLKAAGFEDVPRQANEQYAWVRQRSNFYAVLSNKPDGFELKEMRPGDLLFWTGTYKIDRDPPVTHTMIYLGRRKKDGRPLMLGASDGRPYDGQRRNGVSVFDFKLPAARAGDHADATTAAVPERSPDFAGYGPIPGMAERNDVAARRAAAALSTRSGQTSAR